MTTEREIQLGPWIGWNGGERSVKSNTEVEAMLDNGKRVEKYAFELNWDINDSSPIIAYRVKQEVRTVTMTGWVREDEAVFGGVNLNNYNHRLTIQFAGDKPLLDTVKIEEVGEIGEE